MKFLGPIKNPLLKFVLSFMAIYFVFVISNTVEPIKNAHHIAFAKIGMWVYNSWHPDIYGELSTDAEEMGADPNNDYVLTAFDKNAIAEVKLHNRQFRDRPKTAEPIYYMSFKARQSHAVATFFLLSLILATPNSWRQKLIGSIVALYILYIFVAMKITFLLQMANNNKTSEDGVWYFLSGLIGNNQTYAELFYILVLALWIMVSISSKSINTLTKLSAR